MPLFFSALLWKGPLFMFIAHIFLVICQRSAEIKSINILFPTMLLVDEKSCPELQLRGISANVPHATDVSHVPAMSCEKFAKKDKIVYRLLNSITFKRFIVVFSLKCLTIRLHLATMIFIQHRCTIWIFKHLSNIDLSFNDTALLDAQMTKHVSLHLLLLTFGFLIRSKGVFILDANSIFSLSATVANYRHVITSLAYATSCLLVRKEKKG